MGTFLVVVAIAFFVAAVIVFVMALRRSGGAGKVTPGARQDPLKFGQIPQFGPRQLGPGAIVSYGGVDLVVRGSVTMRQGPFVWWEHLLEGGPEPLWFSVEEDEGRLELVMWRKRTGLPPQPGDAPVVDGLRFHEIERGQASYTTEGTTGLPAGGEMSFVDYATEDESRLLGYELWAPNMAWEVSVGDSVSPGELTVYPAPPASA